MTVSTDLRARVNARVDELVAKAQARYPGFQRPLVQFFENRAAAGLARYRTHAILFNGTLLAENQESMLRETVAHEVAHLLVHFRYRREFLHPRPKPHGQEWQAVMRELFGVEPERTHDYDMSNVQVRRQREWLYVCDCKEHAITTVRHNKIQRGAAYRCSRCRTRLRPTE